MADQTMVVVESVKAGILDIAGHASAKAGNAAGGSDWYMPNDGKTVLMFVADIAGDTVTFVAVTDRYGRTETLAPVVAASKIAMIGPFLPELWNDSQGRIKFSLTTENAADKLLAVRVGTPS